MRLIPTVCHPPLLILLFLLRSPLRPPALTLRTPQSLKRPLPRHHQTRMPWFRAFIHEHCGSRCECSVSRVPCYDGLSSHQPACGSHLQIKYEAGSPLPSRSDTMLSSRIIVINVFKPSTPSSSPQASTQPQASTLQSISTLPSCASLQACLFASQDRSP
ncbi:hypothetical protein FB451DRAFT_1241566 [Mycena latifolia]|nr:hypothetical protein FB451DRAFT_1241566 [Mycena latifolia]